MCHYFWLYSLTLLLAIDNAVPDAQPGGIFTRDTVIIGSESLVSAAPGLRSAIAPDAIAKAIATSSNVTPVPHQDRVSTVSKAAMVVAVAGFNYWYYKGLEPVWWDGDGANFHVINDWFENYALEQDKFSHFFAAQFMAHQWAAMYEAIGWSRRKAYFWGGISALITETETEILDGFTRRFGFSIPDYLADVAGSFYPYFQQVYPSWRSVKMKMSYRASPFYLGSGTDIFEDYDGMTFWWSFNIQPIMPAPMRKYYPEFLRLAIGYGVDRVWTGPNRTRQLYVALDFDFSSLPVKNRLFKYLLNLFNQVHLGAPTLQVYPRFKKFWYFY